MRVYPNIKGTNINKVIVVGTSITVPSRMVMVEISLTRVELVHTKFSDTILNLEFQTSCDVME